MIEIRLDPRRIVRRLAGVTAFLVAMGFGVQWSRYKLGHGNLFGVFDLFNLDGEGNVPSWFESLLFLFASAQLFLIARVKKTAGNSWASYWKGLGFVFLALSADEIVAIHERSIKPLRHFFHIQGGYLYYAWVILGLLFVLALGIFYLRFFTRLPGGTRRDFAIAAALFLGGVLGVESLGGQYAALHGQDNWTYSLLAVLEETLEMAGLLYWIRSLFSYMRLNETPGDFHLIFKP